MPSNPQIYLAPVQGVTHDIYRRTFHRCFTGVDKDFAPFVRLRPGGGLPAGIKNHLPPFDPAIPLVPQLLSNHAGEFSAFDQQLQMLGYPEFNWNLGCPVPMVILKKRGAGLLPHVDQIQALLEQVMPGLRCRLSIKLRLGLDHPDEILNLIPVFNQFPIQELIIHPRIGRQMYRGRVDLNKFAECVALSKLPAVYNGDIFNVATLAALQNQFPQVDRWMLGRGILANPFLPAQIKGLEQPADKLEQMQRFHEAYAQQLAQALSGPAHIVDRLREFWNYTHHLFAGGPAFFRELKKLKHYDAYRSAVDRFFLQKPAIGEHLQITSEDFGD
jgi:tRNA-dihydrouridine synthase